MKNQSIKLNKALKISFFVSNIFFVSFVLSGCAKNNVVENEQNQDNQVIEELKKQNEEQQKQLNDLQNQQSQQTEQTEQANQADDSYKKQECLAENSKLQEEMNRAKRTLSEDQEDLEEAESGKYEKDCLKTQRDEDICDKNSRINLKSRKEDVQEDMDWISKIELKIVDLKNRCADYL